MTFHVVLFCGILIIPSIHAVALMGPYRCVEMQEFKQCDEVQEDSEIKILLSVRKNGSQNVLAGDLIINTPTDETVSGVGRVYKKSKSGWGLLYEYKRDNICKEGIKVIPDIMNKMFDAGGMERKCPFGPGHKIYRNFDTCLQLKKFRNLPYGQFKISIHLYKEQRLLGCFEFQAKVDPLAVDKNRPTIG